MLLGGRLTSHLVEYRIGDTALVFIVELEVMVCVGILEAAQGFMLSSETRIDHPYIVFDGIDYGVIVAGGKMQEGHFTQAPPVSAVKLFGFIIEKGHRNPLSRHLRYRETAPVTEIFAKKLEEGFVQKGPYSGAHVLDPCPPVEQVKFFVERGRGARALYHTEVDSGVLNGAPLPLNFGPAAGFKGEKEIVETAVSPIEPEQVRAAQPQISVFGKDGVQLGLLVDKVKAGCGQAAFHCNLIDFVEQIRENPGAIRA